jgi:hypothetical protein
VRITEQRHQPVAELFQHMTAETGHRRRSLVEIGVDECAPVFGVEVCGETCRAYEIAEHDCDRAALGRDSGTLRRRTPRLGNGDVRSKLCAGQCGDRVEQLSSIAERRDADVLEVVIRQPRQ